MAGYNATTNTIDTDTVQGGQPVVNTNNPAFQSGGAIANPIQPGQNIGSATTLGNTNTSQPSSPTGDQQVQQNQQNAGKLGIAIPGVGGTISSDAQATADKYKTALANTSGTAPTSQGEATAHIQSITGQTNQDQQTQQQNQQLATTIQNQLKNDPGYQQIVTDHNAQMTSQAQQQTLEQEYKKLSTDAGLPALNTQLINMKAIMDGSENDIRNEITKAGGFATESQVMALTTARNKSLLQNYNTLLATRDNAVNQINTMIGLSEKDRTIAQQQATDQINYDKQIYDYQQKFTQNAQDSLTSMQKTEGWDGIYKAAMASGDPNAIARINSTMGNGFNLQTMALADAQTRANALVKTQNEQAQAQATLANTQANTANTRENTLKTKNEVNDTNGVPNPAKAGQPGYTSTGVKLNPQSGTQQIISNWNNNKNWDPSNPGLIPPSNYNQAKAWWIENKIGTASDFDGIFGGYRSQAIIKQYN